MEKCTVKSEWFQKKDINGFMVSEWGQKKSGSEVFCMLCAKTFSVSWGFSAIEQHASTRKHRELCKVKLSSSQLHLSSARPGCCSDGVISSPKATPSIQLYSARQAASRAELIWCLKMIGENFAVQPACEDVKETFEAMFPESVPSEFTLSRTKARYLVCDPLAPYFKKQLVDDIGGAHFSLCFDETVNAASKKELQTVVKYWSDSKQMIMTRHLKTFFIGKATASDIYSKLNEALDNAQHSRSKLLMLGCDGPNVNKTVNRLMNDSLILLGRKQLIDVGTCNIHIIHNAFQKGLQDFGENASDMILFLYNFFDGQTSRWEDFEKIQSDMKLPGHRFMKHVSSRWLTLEPAGERLLEQWSAVEKYFLQFIPQHKSKLMSSLKYKNIVKLLKDKTTKAEIMFACASAHTCSRFTGFLQKRDPLMHLIYNELTNLVRTLMNRFCVSAAPLSLEAFCDKYYLPLKNIVFDTRESEYLKKLSAQERCYISMKARKHYVSACTHILEKSSLDKPVLWYLRCLHPAKRVKEGSYKNIVKLAAVLPIEYSEHALVDEWKLLTLEEEKSGSDKNPVDVYWSQFFEKTYTSGEKKYPTVMKIVKAALALSHGNADVERGFSLSGNILNEDTTNMCERTWDAYLIVRDAVLNVFEGKAHYVIITQELLQLARTAHVRYKQYCEDEKRMAEEKLRKQEEQEKEKLLQASMKSKFEKEKVNIEHGEQALKKMKEEEKEKRLTVDRLLDDANKCLKEAINKKDLVGISVAQAMLESATKVREQEVKKIKDIEKVQKAVDKRKSSVITTFFSKKQKQSET